ncbi:MAG: hypothetical protein L0Y79_01050 [Chlorobi bacterium]|nr:hypothetical protein [Chlorobiota bacterium]MCI0716716.1 hypothetical protein [Chlorobiota bacterium]
MTLLELLYYKPDLILLDSTNCLVRAQLQHYKPLSPELIRFRFLKLFQALVKCVETNSFNGIIKFMDKVSDERYELGFEIHEVQTAINILEECLWKKILKFVDDDKQISAMKQVTRILCNAKMELAGRYALLSKEYIYN